MGELGGDTGAGRRLRHFEALGKSAQLAVHIRRALEVEPPTGQVSNFERVAEKLFGEVGFAGLAAAVDREGNNAARVMSCANARCAALWSATGQSGDGATSGQSGSS